MFEQRIANVDYHHPHEPVVPQTREYSVLAGRVSVPLSDSDVARHDAVVIATDHYETDHGLLAKCTRLVIDTRNAMGSRGHSGLHIVKA